jgi:signal transduction histidine kinase
VDVTARKLAEEALRRAEKMAATGRLSASIAHEINNPLEAITNLLYLAKQSAVVPEVHEYLNLADAEVKRVSYIARRTLGFYKDGTERKTLRIDQIVSDVLTIYHSRLETRKIEVKCELAPASVDGYEGELRQVVSNLLLNAVEASPLGSRLCVRVRTGRHFASCLIADEGSGIAASNRGRIFEPFFTTKKDTGTGLGLWVSQEIVRRHDGRLTFKSPIGIKSGTVFRLTLPAHA